MRIIHTIAGTRVDHGGTSRSVPNLCSSISSHGWDVELIAGRPADSGIRSNAPSESVGMTWLQESTTSRHWGMYRRFSDAVGKAICTESVVHDHGLWLATNRATAAVARRMSTARIVSPRGMLSQWSMNNGRWKKRIAWWLFQHRDLLTATAFHATGHQEAEDLRALGFEQPIAVIPNGIVFPDVMPQPEDNGDTTRTKKCLFLSRIHKVKGLLNLLHAWKDAAQNENWKLILAGPDENGHQRDVRQLANSLGLTDQIEFAGPVTDQEKWQLYRDSDLFVLPSFSENFGIVIAEALAAGLPVITTTPTPWEALKERNLGWWVDPEIPALTDALRAAIQLSDSERVAMGNAGAVWATQQFGWDGIAEQMIEFYQWLLDRSRPKPEFVV